MMRCFVMYGLGLVMFITGPIGVAQPIDENKELDIPVSVDNSATYRFEILSDSGYTDERGRRVIDVLEGYQVNLALSVDTTDGQPVIGLEPKFDLKGSSLLIPPGQSSPLISTD